MQPRRQRTHYLPLTLTSYLPPSLLTTLLNAPWPMATNVQDQMCAFWYNTFIMNALSLRKKKKKKEEKGIKETKNRYCHHSHYKALWIELMHSDIIMNTFK